MNHSHALVVGGTRGLGRGLVELWSEGTDAVSVIGRNLPVADIAAPRAMVRYYTADVTDENRVASVIDEIVRVAGPVARLVFSQRYRGQSDSFDGELEVSLKGTRRIIEHVVARDQFAQSAAIVVVSSVLGRFIAAEQPLGYHVTRAALDQLVRFYAVQLAPRGIRVNSVAPNLIEKEEGREFYRQNSELKQHYQSVIPLGQMGTPRDVAYAIDFLCSDRAAHITGQTLVVDGGLTAVMQHSLGARPPVSG